MFESGGPTMAPTNYMVAGGSSSSSSRGGGGGGEFQEGDTNTMMRWKQFDNSVSAVSFGFVATAILISMFLLMAIFERLFLRPSSPTSSAAGPPRRRNRSSRASNNSADLEAQHVTSFSAPKLYHPSPKMSVYARGVSVLMPGNDIPTFIAHPAPCPPERISWPSHHHISSGGSTLS